MKQFRVPLFVLLVLVVAMFACGGGNGGPEATEPVETPTLVLDPTARPEPIDAPEPADALEPTATSEPAGAPGGPPAEVRRYFLEVSEKGGTLGEAMGTLGQLLVEPRLGDEEWMLDVVIQAALIQVTHQELSAMEVPADMEEFHEAFLDGTSDCDSSMDALAKGIDELDADQLWTAAELMGSCGSKTTRATEMILDYMAQFE